MAYDPCYAYELAVIIHEGLRRMYEDGERVFFYVTVMNENYPQPPMPKAKGVREGIVKGMYRLRTFGDFAEGDPKRVRLLGSGTVLRDVLKAAQRLLEGHGVSSEVWSVTSFTELARDGADVERWNLLHPVETPRRSHVAACLDGDVPVVASTDYVRRHAEAIRPYFDAPYRVLGTDGFGRSDTREKLRHFFEVDEKFVALAALEQLARRQVLASAEICAAIEKMGIDPDKPNPRVS